MKNLLLLFLALLFLETAAFPQESASVPDRDDNQVWHETIVSVPLSEKFSLNFNGVVRYSTDSEGFGDKRVGIGLSYQINNNINASASYLYRKTELVEGQENFEHRFTGAITPSRKFGKYTVSNRNQFEYQSRHSRSDKWVYRNRTQIEREINLSGFQLLPYTSAEVFYDSQFETFSRLRVIVGAVKRINKNFAFEAYYLRQQDGRTVPGDLNVFGTTLRIFPFAKK